MKPIFRSWFRTHKSRIERRLDNTRDAATSRPVLSTRTIDYDVSRRDRAIAHGGIGLIHTLARKVGLHQAIDERLHLLKVNLLAQLHGGMHALTAPVDALMSNAAWMVMTALAWTLKAWWALMLPESPSRWQDRHHEEKTRVLRMEFKTFVNAFVTIPCQVIRTARSLVLRLLS